MRRFGVTTYKLEYLEAVARDNIPAVPKRAREQIERAIVTRLALHPFELGKPLRYSLKGARRLRVGHYRIIYRIEEPATVVILKIGHRKEGYGD